LLCRTEQNRTFIKNVAAEGWIKYNKNIRQYKTIKLTDSKNQFVSSYNKEM